MADGDLIVADYDVEFNGVLIANNDSRDLIVADIFNSPDMRTTDIVRGQLDGMYPGRDYYAGRKMVMEIELWETSLEAYYATVSEIRRALVLQRGEIPLTIKVPGWPETLQVNARPRATAGPQLNIQNEMYVGRIVVEFYATDPRLYGLITQSGQVGLPVASGGLEFDLVFDLSFGASGISNLITATNAGNYETGWQAVITGPITNPSINHVQSGKTLEFNGSVAADETLVIRSQPEAVVLLNGTASRYFWLNDSTQWFMLEPGLNEVRFGGSSVGSPTMTLTWRNAWV